MGLKTALSFLLSASMLAGCHNKSMLDANRKRCPFVMHPDFYTQREDICEPEVFRIGSFDAKVVYQHRYIEDRTLEIYTHHNNKGEMTLKDVDSYRLTQGCAGSNIVEITYFKPKDNICTWSLYDRVNDVTIRSQTRWRGMDGRSDDPIIEFLRPSDTHFINRDTTDVANLMELKPTKSPYMN